VSILNALTMNLRQVAFLPVLGPMLSNANVWNKFAANSGAASYKRNDDVGNRDKIEVTLTFNRRAV
jgi:hypothetical protein